MLLTLLGAAGVVLAFLGARQLQANPRIRRWMRGVLGGALPGARTGQPDAVRTAAAPGPSARLQWTEVVNLTAARTASPPRRTDPKHESAPVTAETR